ncbi:unnamed protein product [Ixodes pacificus]
MTSSPKDSFTIEIRPSSEDKKPLSPSEDGCRIVITDCEMMVSGDRIADVDNNLSPWSGQETPSVFDEGDLSRSDSQPRRHHKHHRRHHRHNNRASQAEDLSVGRCQSRLVIEDDFPSDCETVATTNEAEEEAEEDQEGRRDKKAEMIVVTVSAVILTIALLLIGITLALTPKIDEMGE